MAYFILTCLVFALAITINSVSVYLQKRHVFYGRWGKGWLAHSLLITPAWATFIFLVSQLHIHYLIPSAHIALAGYFLLAMGLVIFMAAIYEIGPQALVNGNLFGKGRLSHNGIYRFLKNPIYDSYIMAFVVIGVIAAAAGGGSKSPTSSSTTKTNGSNAAQLAKIGQAARDGKFEFEHTSEIEGTFGNLRTFIRRMYHHTSPEKFPDYVREFCFRFSTPELFESPQLYCEKTLILVPIG